MVERDFSNTILELQEGLTTLVKKVEKALSLNGKCSKKLQQELSSVISIINIFYRYKTFTSEVTNAAKIEFSSIEATGNPLGLDIIVNGVTIGSFSAEFKSISATIKELSNNINSGTDTHNYLSEYCGDVLYIYSYDSSVSFSHLPTITTTSGNTTTTITTLQNTTCEILNLWNCLKLEDLCVLQNYLLKIYQKHGCLR